MKDVDADWGVLSVRICAEEKVKTRMPSEGEQKSSPRSKKGLDGDEATKVVEAGGRKGWIDLQGPVATSAVLMPSCVSASTPPSSHHHQFHP